MKLSSTTTACHVLSYALFQNDEFLLFPDILIFEQFMLSEKMMYSALLVLNSIIFLSSHSQIVVY